MRRTFPVVGSHPNTMSAMKIKAWLTLTAVEALRHNGRIHPESDEVNEAIQYVQHMFLNELKNGNTVEVEAGMILQFVYNLNRSDQFILQIYCDEDKTVKLGGCEADSVHLIQGNQELAVLTDFSKSKTVGGIASKAANALKGDEPVPSSTTRSQQVKRFFR